ncbi:MAG: DciA family protein [Polyangiales bacterium]
MRRRSGEPENVRVLVARIYPSQSREELEAIQAFGAFARALSQRVLRNARPVKLMRGTLFVNTSNSAWANTLQLESTALLAKLKRVAPEARVRRLVFRAGPLPDAALPPPHTPLVAAKQVPLRELPEDLARELARIHDDTLRDAVSKAARVGLASRVDDDTAREPRRRS